MSLATILLSLLLVVPVDTAALDWPISGQILRGFDGGDSPYSAGHRGIDIAAPVGTTILAPGPGTVAFAGKVAGSLYVSIDHPGGLRSTCSWLTSVSVKTGDVVQSGDVIGTTGLGHPGTVVPHLHFGVRLDGTYVDPMGYLPLLDLGTLIRLVPLRGP